MSKTIIVIGEASKRSYSFNISENDLKLTVLDFLLLKNFPIAYSCKSQGVCRKCIINYEILSCSYTVEDFIKEYNGKIKVSYL